MCISSNKIARSPIIISVLMLLLFSTSCTKDEVEPNGGGGDPTVFPMVITADINFVDNGETFDFEGYDKGSNMVISKDTSLIIGFESTDKYGKAIEGPGIGIHINDANGIHQGAVYTIGREGMFAMAAMNPTSAYLAQNEMGSGEVRITFLSETRIKGTFEFTAVRPLENPKTVIVSNGQFDSEVLRR